MVLGALAQGKRFVAPEAKMHWGCLVESAYCAECVGMLKIGLLNLTRHKTRTALAVFGIVLGVASLIVLVSVIDGIRFEIKDAFSKAQGVRIGPLKAGDPTFSQFDEEWIGKIEKVQGVKVAVGNIIQVARTIDGKQQAFNGTRVLGIDVDRVAKAESSGFQGELLEGRDFRAGDRGIALIGKKVKGDYDKFLGSKIKVNDTSFRIVGIYTTGSDLLDNSILLQIDDARESTGFPKGKVSYLNATIVNPKEDRQIAERINLIYGDKVKARTLSDFSAQFGQVFDSITALVLIVASIASIVAAVGIINTMLMSVLERFREIGALKAVGWTNGNVMKMILYESLFVGAIGGLFGVTIGYLGSSAVEGFGLTTVVTPELMLGSFLGAVAVGVLGGIYPAFIASRMDPVEALRTE